MRVVCVTIVAYESYLTVRLTDEILDWLKETSRRTGIPVGRLIREQLETTKSKGGKQCFLRHAGAIAGGPPDVSFSQRIFPLMKGIADTGFIVAFARGNDQHHVWAVDIAKQITEPLLTCEAVLAEAAFQLESSSYVLALLQDEMLRLALTAIATSRPWQNSPGVIVTATQIWPISV